MSPLTAQLKCPHGNGEDTHGREAVTEVAFDQDGGGRQDHPEGGGREDGCVLQADKADPSVSQAAWDEGARAWELWKTFKPSFGGESQREGDQTVQGSLLGL